VVEEILKNIWLSLYYFKYFLSDVVL
jgi:hypothetical protein